MEYERKTKYNELSEGSISIENLRCDTMFRRQDENKQKLSTWEERKCTVGLKYGGGKEK